MGDMNPVLAAYVTGLQLRRQAEDLALRKQKLAQEDEQFGKQYTEMQRQFDERMKMEAEKLKRSQELQKATFGVHAAQLKETALGNIGKTRKFAPDTFLPRGTFGEDVAYDVNNMTNLAGQPEPGHLGSSEQTILPSTEGFPGVSIRSDEILTPAERGEAAFEVQRPTLEYKGKQAIDQAYAKFASQSALQKQKDEAADARNKATIEGRKDVAAMMASARRYAADRQGSTTLKANMDDIAEAAMAAATGEGDITGFTDKAILTRGVLRKHGYVEFKKKDVDKLKAIHDVDNLYSAMEDFASKLPTTTPGAIGQLFQSKITGTDKKNFRDKIRGLAANVSHTYGGEIGRLSDPDVERAIGLLVTPGITQEQAKQRLEDFRKETKTKVMHGILGGQSTRQKLANLTKYGFNPSDFDPGVNIGDKTVRMFKQDSDGEWLYFDPKTKMYHSMD